MWNDHLAKALLKAGFQQSSCDPGVFYHTNIALAVYVDDVLLFGPCSKIMSQVISDPQTNGFELKVEKAANDQSFDILGVHIDKIKDSNGTELIQMTQHGLI